MSTYKHAVKSWHNVMGQNENNNRLAAEYKTATDERRQEIFEEYYANNELFITTWKRWEREHWAELTQNFVTLWHTYFSRYTPTSDKSVFNFYMDQTAKRHAAEDYKRFIQRTNCWTGYESRPGDEYKSESGRYRKELYVHPTSASDVATLKSQLCRNLDTKEQQIMEHYFFGDMSHTEVAESFFQMGKMGKKSKSPGGVSKYSYHYRNTWDNMLRKLAIHYKREDF